MDIYENIKQGDKVMCVEKLPYITKNNFYNILGIFKISGDTYCQIVDDGQFINSYKLSSFISLEQNRENNLLSFLSN